jgi:hypothetical protein
MTESSSTKLKIKEFLIDFGNKFLFYIFVVDFILASWYWIDTYGPLDLFTKIKMFFTILPIVFVPSIAKVSLKDTEKREENIKFFDVIYGIFIWILTLILSSMPVNILSLMAVVFILYLSYIIISIISWYYNRNQLFRTFIVFIIINVLVIYYLLRFYESGIDYYNMITIYELVAGIFVFAIVAFIFVYNEIGELLYIFRLQI